MSQSAVIRLARVQDAAQVQAIYAPFVRDTPVSFELEPPSVEEMRQRIKNTLRQFPWLACERQGRIIGYVYAGSHQLRDAYLWSVNVTVYVDSRFHRSGIGRALYSSLFAVLRLQGFYNAYAGVTLPNPASVGLHEALGFQPVGVYQAAGYKSGAWHSVGWWQLTLQELAAAPSRPLLVSEAEQRPEWRTALQTGLPLLRF